MIEEAKSVEPSGDRLCAVSGRTPHQGGNCFAAAEYWVRITLMDVSIHFAACELCMAHITEGANP